jgi:hypothetical protein
MVIGLCPFKTLLQFAQGQIPESVSRSCSMGTISNGLGLSLCAVPFPKYVPCISKKVEHDPGGSRQQTIRDLDVRITKGFDICGYLDMRQMKG